MSVNQYAVYRLKPDGKYDDLRNKPYSYIQERHMVVYSDNYHQVFIAKYDGNIGPQDIRKGLEDNKPSSLQGNGVAVSDVIVITKDGISSAYYVDDHSMVMIPGFFRFNSSAALITMETTGYVFDDRKGSWMAADETIVDGKQFFLMVSETYGRNAAYAVVDDQGQKAAEDTANGFDETTIQQIREFLKTKEQSQIQGRTAGLKQRLEIWQKYHENGEYLRSIESGTEENDNMIDGISNNRGSKRVSVLQRLKEKQKEVAARYGKAAVEKDGEELNRK